MLASFHDLGRAQTTDYLVYIENAICVSRAEEKQIKTCMVNIENKVGGSHPRGERPRGALHRRPPPLGALLWKGTKRSTPPSAQEQDPQPLISPAHEPKAGTH